MKSTLDKIKLIFIFIYLVTSVSLYFILDHYNYKTAQKLIKENLLMAEAIQKYVSDHQKTVVDKLVKEGKLSPEYFNPSLMSATHIVTSIQNNYKNSKIQNDDRHYRELDFKFASDNPTNPANLANEFESKVLKIFNTTKENSYTEVIEHNGEKSVFYAFAVEANTPKCLQCHGNIEDAPKDMLTEYGTEGGFGEKLGEIRAINAVYAPMDVTTGMLSFYIVLNLFVLFIYLSIYFTLRYFFLELMKKDELLAKQSRFAALGEMISMIAHQWRQPLTGMSMSLNNLLLDIDLDDVDTKRSKETLELVNKQIAYLSSTIDDFKNFFKPDIKPEIVNLRQLVVDACFIIDSSIKSNSIKLDITICEDISISTKKNDVIQIILNLVKNSMDAYKESDRAEKSIEISFKESNKYVAIIVKDYAGGIPSDIIDSIFDPYFSTKDKKNGTGLGLYMSKMIVENHLSGELSVEVEGESTIFTIKFLKKEMLGGYKYC
jgi:signal transduction histidine kinase/polyhydroxyalkanoate synthesis regulator phasin